MRSSISYLHRKSVRPMPSSSRNTHLSSEYETAPPDASMIKRLPFSVDAWLKERDSAINSRDNELRRLKLKNIGLLKDLKRLNTDASARLALWHPRRQSLLYNPPILKEIALTQEMYALEKSEAVTQNEIAELKSKLNVDTEYSRVLELEKRLSCRLAGNSSLIKRSRQLAQRIARNDSRITKQKRRECLPLPEDEVVLSFPYKGGQKHQLGKSLAREMAKTKALEEQINRETEKTSARKELADKLAERIRGLEAEIAENLSSPPLESIVLDPHRCYQEEQCSSLNPEAELSQLKSLLQTERAAHRRKEQILQEDIDVAKSLLEAKLACKLAMLSIRPRPRPRLPSVEPRRIFSTFDGIPRKRYMKTRLSRIHKSPTTVTESTYAAAVNVSLDSAIEGGSTRGSNDYGTRNSCNGRGEGSRNKHKHGKKYESYRFRPVKHSCCY